MVVILQLQVVSITSRTASFEIENNCRYFLSDKVSVFLNDEKVDTVEKNVFTLRNLEPSKEYCIYIQNDSTKEVSNKVVIKTKFESVTVNVKDFGARGNGESLDTLALQAAINACPEDGRVLMPKGRYLTTPLFLKSNITIHLEKDAVLLGVNDREKYPILPGILTGNDGQKEYYLGSWEGEPLDCFASLITGINIKDVNIIGEGIIDGNASFETWWKEAKKKRIAWRPRTIFFNGCEDILVEGIKVQNSPSWTIHPLMSKNLKFINFKIINPPDSPNTDGINPESCDNVLILGGFFSLGDDCIAIKSGKLYMGKKVKMPSQNINVRNCYMKYGHGAVTIGSEMSGGINNINVQNCIFENTDRGIRIKTRRGRGATGIIDEIHVNNVHMNGVLTPFVINSFYFCDDDGHIEYVWTKKLLPVDDRTPYIKNIYIKNVKCENAHVASGFMYGLPEQKIEKVVMENVYVHFEEKAKSDYAAMMDYIEPMCRNGFYFNNVKHLLLKNIHVQNSLTEPITTENIDCEDIE